VFFWFFLFQNPPCLGAISKGLLGGSKNSAGNACTEVAYGDRVWIDRNPTFYPTPQAIPPQAVSQRPVVPVAPSAIPRQRVCVLYNYNLKHDDDAFTEYQGGSEQIGVLPDGTTYGKWNRYPAKPVWGPCTFVNLEGDLLDVNGNIVSKFKLGGDYPTVPCLGAVSNAFFGGL
jgi:hypothetical protein